MPWGSSRGGEEVWNGLKPSYQELFDGGKARGPQPTAKEVQYSPFMLANRSTTRGSD